MCFSSSSKQCAKRPGVRRESPLWIVLRYEGSRDDHHRKTIQSGDSRRTPRRFAQRHRISRYPLIAFSTSRSFSSCPTSARNFPSSAIIESTRWLSVCTTGAFAARRRRRRTTGLVATAALGAGATAAARFAGAFAADRLFLLPFGRPRRLAVLAGAAAAAAFGLFFDPFGRPRRPGDVADTESRSAATASAGSFFVRAIGLSSPSK